MNKKAVTKNEILEVGFFLFCEKNFLGKYVCRNNKNTPHVSLFQIAIEAYRLNSLLECFSEKFNNIDQRISLYIKSIKKIDGNIALDLSFTHESDKKAFLKIKKEVISFSLKYLTPHVFLSQINFQKLSNEEKKLVQKFGIHWGVSNKDISKPHLTLCYQKSLNEKYDEILLRDICFSKLGIGLIGYYGNVTKVIKEINLK